MIQTATRPFTDAEREEVEARLLEAVGGPTYKIRDILSNSLSFAYFGALFGGTLGFLLDYLHMSTACAVSAGIVVTFCFFLLGIFDEVNRENKRAEIRKQNAAGIARRLQRGEIEETQVTASGVVRVVDEDEGEVSGFFFDIGGDRVMFLREETLWSFLENTPWCKRDKELVAPSAFRIAWYPDAVGHIIQFESLGPDVSPLRTVGATNFDEEYYALADGEIIEDVALATLATDLPYLSVVDDEP